MHITAIHQTTRNQGFFVLIEDVSLKTLDDLNEKQLLFDLRIKADQLVAEKFPEHFKDISTVSDPAIEDTTLTIYVSVTENVDNALLDAAESLGIELTAS